MAWLYGPKAAGALSVEMTCLPMAFVHTARARLKGRAIERNTGVATGLPATEQKPHLAVLIKEAIAFYSYFCDNIVVLNLQRAFGTLKASYRPPLRRHSCTNVLHDRITCRIAMPFREPG